MKSLIWDLLLLLLFMYYQSKLRVGVWEATHGQAFSLDNKCADDILLSDLLFCDTKNQIIASSGNTLPFIASLESHLHQRNKAHNDQNREEADYKIPFVARIV